MRDISINGSEEMMAAVGQIDDIDDDSCDIDDDTRRIQQQSMIMTTGKKRR